MKFLVATVLAGLALAEVQDVACPTITKQILNPECSQACNTADCTFVTTVQNPCGCPMSVPTATLLAPCDAGCPYNGCDVQFRSAQHTCGPTTMTTTRTRTRPTSTPTSTSTSSTSSSPSVSTGVTTLPPKTTATTAAACPTVTRHTQPADCEPLRCPVPSCYVQETLGIPCGCDGPKTLLYVEGCSTVCAEGCATRTSTSSEICARATGLQ